MTDRCYPLDREWDELFYHWPMPNQRIWRYVDVQLVDLPQISDKDWERMAEERNHG